ncbi:hypothetical protein S83_059763, partial [Arachis hypogaea]
TGTFDTASVYGSEQALREAIVEALKLVLTSSKDDLFITSKLWLSDNHADLVLPALRKSLQSLGLEDLDFYLIYWPMSAKPGLFKGSLDFTGTISQIGPCKINWNASSGSECFISDLFGERVSMDNTIHHLVSIFGLGAGLCYQK